MRKPETKMWAERTVYAGGLTPCRWIQAGRTWDEDATQSEVPVTGPKEDSGAPRRFNGYASKATRFTPGEPQALRKEMPEQWEPAYQTHGMS